MKLRSAALTLPLFLFAAPQLAQNSQESRFHRAYYLEQEEGQLEEALALYREVAGSSREGAWRERAEARAAALTEELATNDFARILPANTILYAELNRPGAQLSSLLDQLGLLGSVRDALAKKSVALSPELVDGVLGIRGAAVALTSLPIHGDQAPGGVAILHPGDLGLLRGLIESAVPVQGQIVDTIGGHPTYLIEDHVYITFSHRLILASASRGEIEGCLRRMQGDDADSMANDRSMKENLAMRGDDLLYVCVNAQPLQPMLNAMLTREAGQRELAMAQALVDLESLESLVVRAGVAEDGLSMEAALRLDDAHRSLAFHFLRSATLDPRTLSTVPAGAAAFVASAFNPAGPAIAPLEVDGNGRPVVTAMDLGRELFTNSVGMALFALPEAGQGPIPGVTLALTTNDAARTEAVFGLLLSVAQVISGSVELDPGTQRIAGRPAQVYRVGEGIPIYQASTEETYFVSSTTRALEQTLQALGNQRSVHEDPAFAAHLARMGEGVNQAVALHGGRMLSMARPYVNGNEAQMLNQVAPVLEQTVVSMISRHSANELGFSMQVTGIPKVDGLLSGFLAQQMRRQEHRVAAVPAPQRAIARETRRSETIQNSTHEEARTRFDRYVSQGKHQQARALESELVTQYESDARGANNFAWALLTEDRYDEGFDALALRMARISNERDDYSTWQYLDTLALAEFRTGNIENAIRYQKQAMESTDDREDQRELGKTLRRYERASKRSDV